MSALQPPAPMRWQRVRGPLMALGGITVATIAEELPHREKGLSLQAFPFSVQTVFEIPRCLGGAGFALGQRQGIAGQRGEIVDERQVTVLPVRRR